MAIEDYFKGSSQAYGQLAGSLLAGRKKEDKKEAKRALIASTVMASFGALQNQQKQNKTRSNGFCVVAALSDKKSFLGCPVKNTLLISILKASDIIILKISDVAIK